MDDQLDRRFASLMARAQMGDKIAYQAVLAGAAQVVRDYARRRIGGSVDDVVQETLTAVHRALHSYDPARPFGPWLYAIARHRITDLARRERRWLRAEAEASAAASSVVVSEPGNAHFLQRAMAKLSARQRRVIELLKLSEHSVEQTAAETGMSQSAVKVTAHRGVRKLRALLAGGSHD